MLVAYIRFRSTEVAYEAEAACAALVACAVRFACAAPVAVEHQDWSSAYQV